MQQNCIYTGVTNVRNNESQTLKTINYCSNRCRKYRSGAQTQQAFMYDVTAHFCDTPLFAKHMLVSYVATVLIYAHNRIFINFWYKIYTNVDVIQNLLTTKSLCFPNIQLEKLLSHILLAIMIKHWIFTLLFPV